MLGVVASSASSLTRGGTAQRKRRARLQAAKPGMNRCKAYAEKVVCKEKDFREAACVALIVCGFRRSLKAARQRKIDVRVPPRRQSDNPHIPWVRDLQASAPKTCGFQGTRCISTRQMQVMTDAICTIKKRWGMVPGRIFLFPFSFSCSIEYFQHHRS